MLEKELPGCLEPHFDTEAVQAAKQGMPNEDLLFETGEFFKAFADSSRLTILASLLHQELCVCDISAVVGMSQSAVSHQLRVLRNARIVKYRKEGKQVFYSVDDGHIEKIIQLTMDHLTEQEELR